MGGGGSKIIQNCVTSFMDDPKVFSADLEICLSGPQIAINTYILTQRSTWTFLVVVALRKVSTVVV